MNFAELNRCTRQVKKRFSAIHVEEMLATMGFKRAPLRPQLITKDVNATNKLVGLLIRELSSPKTGPWRKNYIVLNLVLCFLVKREQWPEDWLIPLGNKIGRSLFVHGECPPPPFLFISRLYFAREIQNPLIARCCSMIVREFFRRPFDIPGTFLED